jgi:cytosine/creatinine deaminase
MQQACRSGAAPIRAVRFAMHFASPIADHIGLCRALDSATGISHAARTRKRAGSKSPMTDHASFMAKAYDQAFASYQSGGVPVGSVLVRGHEIIGQGHNQRVQQSDPIAHGEMDCLRNAGRQRSYRDTVIYTTLSPCMMCTGTIILFKIPTVVIGECLNFGGNEQLLRDHGVTVIDLNDQRCIDLMARFIRERPDIWNEDIAE